jgi:hypothetical protein
MTNVRSDGIICRALAALLLACACALAQWQVNPQVGRVNNRVGGEMYGNMGSVKYAPYQTNVLPSEARYATWRSGALPSEIRMNASAVGPLPPSGAIAYVPGPSPVQQAYRTPQPQLYNPAYGIGTKPIDDQLRPQAGYPAGSVKYASANTTAQIPSGSMPMSAAASSGWQQPQPGQVNTGQVPTPNISSGEPTLNTGPGSPGGQLFAQSPANLGSVRYQSLSNTATPKAPPMPAAATKPAGY